MVGNDLLGLELIIDSVSGVILLLKPLSLGDYLCLFPCKVSGVSVTHQAGRRLAFLPGVWLGKNSSAFLPGR